MGNPEQQIMYTTGTILSIFFLEVQKFCMLIAKSLLIINCSDNGLHSQSEHTLSPILIFLLAGAVQEFKTINDLT
jgi:hypothetical protein